MFSNPVREMPYFSNFHGLLFYDHPPSAAGSYYFLCLDRSRAPGRGYPALRYLRIIYFTASAIALYASVRRSSVHAAFAGLVDGRQTAGIPVSLSHSFT